MNDDELMELFSAFDDVSAPESLQSSTLDFIMSAAAAAPVTAEAEAEAATGQAPSVTATRGAKARIRNRWRAMRTAAVAACLALALTGGAAYAYPASTVLVTQGETTVELHVNVFGQVLSASASDDETQDIIDQMGLVNTPFSDSVTRVSDSLKESNPSVPVAVVLNGVAQPVEPNGGGKAPQPQSEPTKHEADAPAAVEVPVTQEEQPEVAASEPIVESAPVNVEVPVYLPEPSGTAASDTKSEKPTNSNGTSEREKEQPVKDEPAVEPDPEPTPSDPVEPVVEPSEPVAIDEDPTESEDPQPVDDGSGTEDANDDGEEEDDDTVYDNVRPPQYRPNGK